jgi:hypothetical protein
MACLHKDKTRCRCRYIRHCLNILESSHIQLGVALPTMETVDGEAAEIRSRGSSHMLCIGLCEVGWIVSSSGSMPYSGVRELRMAPFK